MSAHGRNGIGATNPHDVRFLPLLFVVLAIAVRLAPEHIGVDARSRRVTSLRYYWSCKIDFLRLILLYSFIINSTSVSLDCRRYST